MKVLKYLHNTMVLLQLDTSGHLESRFTPKARSLAMLRQNFSPNKIKIVRFLVLLHSGHGQKVSYDILHHTASSVLVCVFGNR